MSDASAEVRRLKLGSCPDSWGVWFASDPLQTPWHRFLDELSDVGYKYLELGPYGYLPTDPNQLRDEVGRRGLTVTGGTVVTGGGVHRAESFESVFTDTRRVAELTAAMGAEHVIFCPVPGYRDDITGAYLEPPELEPAAWSAMIAGITEIGRQIHDDFGVKLQFHPHADSHVETQEQVYRFCEDADPTFVNLCLDVGHLAYTRGDPVAVIQKYPSRVKYVHIKQMDPAILAKAEAEDLAFGQAVALGASCEAPNGLPEIPPILAALEQLDAEFYCIVEQDMYPTDFDLPKPAATRARSYLNSVGL